MSKIKKGEKIRPLKPYERVIPGKTKKIIPVKRHKRSVPR